MSRLAGEWKELGHHPNESWSMDFMSDELYNGQKNQALNVSR